MYSIFFAASDDSHLSRLDPALLSDQAKMEIAFENIVNKWEIIDDAGNYLDIADWPLFDFNENGEVTALACSNPLDNENLKFGGSINFAFFPDSVKHLAFDSTAIEGTLSARLLPQKLLSLSFRGNFMKGTLNLSEFPRTLTEIDAMANKMTGTIDLRALPPNIEVFSCGKNHFEGTLDVSDLPETLRSLSVYENKFRGTIDFGKLKAALTLINLSGNDLDGEVDFTGSACQLIDFDIGANRFRNIATASFPKTLKELYMKDNPIKGFDYAQLPQSVKVLSLPGVPVGGDVEPAEWPADILQIKIAFCEHTGSFAFAHVSRRLQELRIRGNHFIGSVQTCDMPHTLAILDMAENNFSGDFDFTTLPESLEVLDIRSNNFVGEPDLSSLPEDLESINASKNHFRGKIDLSDCPESLMQINFLHNEVEEALNVPEDVLVIL